MELPEFPVCAKCRFWEAHPNGHPWGSCHRYPPRLSDHMLRFFSENPDPDNPEAYQVQEMLRAVHGPDPWALPVVMDDNWCGEWQPKREGQS